MNRKQRPGRLKTSTSDFLADWHQHLITRRRLLLTATGGTLAAIFPLLTLSAENNRKKTEPWVIIDVVQQHLFPAESHAPGAREINALAYLRFVVTDTTLDLSDRKFITQGAEWLEDMAYQLHKKSFIDLGNKDREKVLRRIADSESGENWLSTLLLYIAEALLTDPVYGGNTDQRGWTWLQHVPGYPRPPLDKTFPQLLS